MQSLRGVFLTRHLSATFRYRFRNCSTNNDVCSNDGDVYDEKPPGKPYLKYLGVAVGAALAFGAAKFFMSKGAPVEYGVEKKGLPYYSAEEVARHADPKNRIWIIYKQGVYDITDYVYRHPGTKQILMAAGGSVEPFWLTYGFHQDEHVWKILETFRIGNLLKKDMINYAKELPDPYANEPTRDKDLHGATLRPFCGEVPGKILVKNFITPNQYFYVRNHFPVPVIDPKDYELEVEVEGSPKKITLKLEDLKKLPPHVVTCTTMCSGNRRSEMRKFKHFEGVDFKSSAISNATWKGARLIDILKKVGIDENEAKLKHVQFEGHDIDPGGVPYGGSILLSRAVNPRRDVIVAYEMNGVDIPPDHGYPVRMIIPGTAGARNVKWLAKIIVSENESEGHWFKWDYKGFSPSTTFDDVDFDKSPSVMDLPVNSAISVPTDGDSVSLVGGKILLKGWAWSGNGQKIYRVDITTDGGDTWHVADIDHQATSDPPQHYSWALWSASIPVKPGLKKLEIWSKAVDSSYNTQPESFKNIYNFQGVLANAYNRVQVKLV